MTLSFGLAAFLALPLTLLTACGGGSAGSMTPGPLDAGNTNLIFVVSPDLAYQAPGDISPATANLTSQGLQRSLLMATYLREQVLGGRNVTAITALEPMTHLQTANGYPDLAAMEFIQQFALLNPFSMPGAGPGTALYTGNSFPLNGSYGAGPVPAGVAPPAVPSLGCQGLVFNDSNGDNEALAKAIISANVPGFYVFSAPWETVAATLAGLNGIGGHRLDLPAAYQDPNHVYALSISPQGVPSLVSYDAKLAPPATYPALPAPVAPATVPMQAPFALSRTGGVPAGSNTNETLYLIRHVEAHPSSGYEDGNYVAAGQWRALALPAALRGKILPDLVYAIDPSQAIPLSQLEPGANNVSYVRPALTVEPYAIANDLPVKLVSSLELILPDSPQQTSDFFFTGGTFSNRVILVAWEHEHIPPTVNALLASYQSSGATAPAWPDDDYDTIWRIVLDSQGNVTVDNALAEGIASASLPATAPAF